MPTRLGEGAPENFLKFLTRKRLTAAKNLCAIAGNLISTYWGLHKELIDNYEFTNLRKRLKDKNY